MFLLIAGIKQLGNLSQTCFEESSFTVTNGTFCVVTPDKMPHPTRRLPGFGFHNGGVNFT